MLPPKNHILNTYKSSASSLGIIETTQTGVLVSQQGYLRHICIPPHSTSSPLLQKSGPSIVNMAMSPGRERI